MCYVKLSRKRPDFEKLSRRACAGTLTLYSPLNNFGNKIPLFNDLPSVANLTNSDSFKMKKTKKQVVQTPEN